MTGSEPTLPSLDTALLDGFAFRCRPDCGLCCFAEPRVSSSDRVPLLQIAPEAELVGAGRDVFLASRPDGGACQMLDRLQCRVHAARPAPCREFPITVHVGLRLQATVVLSCPGVSLEGLRAARARTPSPPAPSFREELTSVRGRIDRSVVRRMEDAQRRRRKLARELDAQGRWKDEAPVRTALASAIPLPTSDDFPVAEPPRAEDGLSGLPLFFDGRGGPVAIGAGLGGWALLELSPEGGATPLGVVPPPDRCPPMSPPAKALLTAYLDYWLRRDAVFGAVHLAMAEADEGTVEEWVRRELRGIGALVLARADVRARARRGPGGPLSAEEVAEGIRATDQDLLDRATWGDRL